MTRSKRHKIRRIVLGLAVAALLVPATAHAGPMDLSGSDHRSIHDQSVSFSGSEDVAFSRQQAGNPALVADSGNGYDAGTGTLGGLALILMAAGAAAAVHHSRKAKLSPA
jgi:hypothetical protein